MSTDAEIAYFLAPCSRCSSHKNLSINMEVISNEIHYYIKCSKCLDNAAAGPARKTPEEAAIEWNHERTGAKRERTDLTLKIGPCPACRHTSASIKWQQAPGKATRYYVECAKCTLQGPRHSQIDNSISVWNNPTWFGKYAPSKGGSGGTGVGAGVDGPNNSQAVQLLTNIDQKLDIIIALLRKE